MQYRTFLNVTNTNEHFFVAYTHVSRIATEITGRNQQVSGSAATVAWLTIINVAGETLARETSTRARACLCDIGLPRAYGEFCACSP